jgi:hypothetical protein
MNPINLIINGKLDEAKALIKNRLDEIAKKYLSEAKQYIASEQSFLDENSNIIKVGRISRIRRRIRRDANGRIFVQKNARRSSVKGYGIVGRGIRRITTLQRLKRRQQLKRSWRTTRRSRLSRSLLKRKISMRRRQSMGI